MIQRLTIPNWRPTPDNKLSHTHWAVAKRRKDIDKAMVATYAKKADMCPATGRRRVQLEIVLTGRQKETDPYAYSKSCLDALVACGLLVNDTSEFVMWIPPTYERGERGETTIVLTDLEQQHE